MHHHTKQVQDPEQQQLLSNSSRSNNYHTIPANTDSNLGTTNSDNDDLSIQELPDNTSNTEVIDDTQIEGDDSDFQTAAEPLINPKPKIPYHLSSTRFLWRNPAFNKMLSGLCLDISPETSWPLRIRDGLIYFLFGANSVPQSIAKVPLKKDSFTQGAHLITEIVWPVAFTGLLVHDLVIYFSEPDTRYGNTWQDILLGISNNQQTFLNYLGSQLPGDPLYYNFWPSILLAAPVLTGFGNVFRRRNWLKPFQNNSYDLLNIQSSINQSTNDFSKESLGTTDLATIPTLQSFEAPRINQLDTQSITPQYPQGLMEELQDQFEEKGIADEPKKIATKKLIPTAKILIRETPFDGFTAESGVAQVVTIIEEPDNFNNSQNLSPTATIINPTATHHPLLKRLVDSIAQFDPFGVAVFQDSFNLCWNRDLSEQDQQQILTRLCDIAAGQTATSTFQQCYALRALADIADSFSGASLQLIPEAHRSDYAKIGTQALSHLQTIADDRRLIPSQFLMYLYVHYQLNAIGHRRNIMLPIVWVLSAYLLYAKARLWEIWVLRIVKQIEYYLAQKSCENDNNVWQFLAEFGDYFCSRCGDWPFVPVNQVFTNEGCWDGLFSSQQNATLLTSGAIRLLNQTGFVPAKLDLTQQAWLNWTEAEWQLFLQTLTQYVTQLPLVNLSQPVPSLRNKDSSEVQPLANLLNTVTVDTLDISHLGLGDDAFFSLTPSFKTAPLKTLILSGNNLTDQAMANFTGAIPDSLAVAIWSNNALSDDSTTLLAQQLPKYPKFTQVDLSGNDLGQGSLDALATNNSLAFLTHLDLSNNDLGAADFSFFWQAVGNQSAIQSVRLFDCTLNDQQLIEAVSAVSNSQLNSLDVSYNQITDTGFYYFIAGISAQPNNLTNLEISGNSITDTGLSNAASFIANTSLHYLGLAQNSFTPSGLAAITHISQTPINRLNIASNYLGDQGAQILVQALNQTQSYLVELDYSNNGLTDIGGVPLAAALVKQGISTINFSQNRISDATLVAMAEACSNTNPTTLMVVSLQANQITAIGASALANHLLLLQNSSIDLSNNPLGANGSLAFTKTFITDFPTGVNLNDLGNAQLSIDQARAWHHQSHTMPTMPSLNIANTNLDDATARTWCRILQQVSNSSTVQLSPNSAVGNSVDLSTCRLINPTQILKPWDWASSNNPISYDDQATLPASAAKSYFRTNASQAILLTLFPALLAIMALYLIQRAWKTTHSANQYAGRWFKAKPAQPTTPPSPINLITLPRCSQ